MSDSLSGRGLRVLFATEFYGYVGSKRGLNEAQEFDATREYYPANRERLPALLSTLLLEK